ncbi:MAG: hypothetical protein ACK5HY_15465 [Parahaliea sp.]
MLIDMFPPKGAAKEFFLSKRFMLRLSLLTGVYILFVVYPAYAFALLFLADDSSGFSPRAILTALTSSIFMGWYMYYSLKAGGGSRTSARKWAKRNFDL